MKYMKYESKDSTNFFMIDEADKSYIDSLIKDGWVVSDEKEYKKFQDNNKAIHTQDSVDSALKLEEAIADAKKAGWSDEMIEAGFGRKI
jgi:hypothetical protein